MTSGLSSARIRTARRYYRSEGIIYIIIYDPIPYPSPMRRPRRAGRRKFIAKLVREFQSGASYSSLLGLDNSSVVNHADDTRVPESSDVGPAVNQDIVREEAILCDAPRPEPALGVQPEEQLTAPALLRIRSDVVPSSQIRFRVVSWRYPFPNVTYNYPSCWLD